MYKPTGMLYLPSLKTMRRDFQMECAWRQWLFEKISSFCAEHEISERMLHYDLRALAGGANFIIAGNLEQREVVAHALRCKFEMLEIILYFLMWLDVVNDAGDGFYRFETDFVVYLDLYRTLRWKADDKAETEGRPMDPEGTGIDFKAPM